MYKIFYPDGVFDSETGNKPPPFGVQVILQDGPYGPYLQHRADYYILDNGRWRGCDIVGLRNYLVSINLVKFGYITHIVFLDGMELECDAFGLIELLGQTGVVLFGETLPNDEYQAIYQAAKTEKDNWDGNR